VRCAQAGILGFFGAGALRPNKVAAAIRDVQRRVPAGRSYGFNLLHGSHEQENVDLYLAHKVSCVEASAYIKVTPGLVQYRVAGLSRDGARVRIGNMLMAKLSRPEVAAEFLAPPPASIVHELVRSGLVSAEQARLAERVPMADDICVEADSGGHTDKGVIAVLLPYITRMRDHAMTEHKFAERIRIGAGGGIGTPESVLAAFVLGADFVTTGSINQCSVEAGTSDLVKSMLQEIGVQDTAYAPAGDMFELGAQVQVLRRGVFFPARANRLYELFRQYDSLEALPTGTLSQLEDKVFRVPISRIWQDCVSYHDAQTLSAAERSPKKKLALVFRWYFGLSNRLALEGNAERKVDFQIHCGPALGAFNQWQASQGGLPWQKRHVDTMAAQLLDAAEALWCERTAPSDDTHRIRMQYASQMQPSGVNS
jgi:trans-AT polyketide synthase/acyltransferase/oxidoreductase domain-containing protein